MAVDPRPGGRWADARPNDHDLAGLSRVPPCSHCDHDEHVLRCEAVITVPVSLAEDVLCPCRGVPIPGDYPPTPHHPPSTGAR